MGEPDATTWSDAAESIARLRRRLLRCQLGMFASLLATVPILALYDILDHPTPPIVFAPFVLVAGTLLAVGNTTWLSLINIRCPRCGKYFLAMFGFRFLSNKCKHCGLDLASIAKPKPLDGTDFQVLQVIDEGAERGSSAISDKTTARQSGGVRDRLNRQAIRPAFLHHAAGIA